MLRLAAPMVVTTVSFTVMQFVDRFMVSRLGTTALAAIMPAGIVSFVPAGFAIGAMTAVTTFVSQSFGRGAMRDCSNYCWQAIYAGIAYCTAVAVVVWPAAPWIFKAMGHMPDVAEMEVIYLRIMLLAQIAAVFVWASSQFFVGVHRPIITMYAALVGQIVNIAANYVLIFGKLGLPAMGIAGAGWGTFIGVVAGAAIRMTMFLTGRIAVRFHCRRTMAVDFEKMKDLMKVGLPVGFELMTNVAFWGVILYSLVAMFGKENMAATSAVLACTDLSIMPVVGVAIALTAAVGRSVGLNRKDLAVRQTAACLKIAMVYMGMVAVVFLLFRHELMEFWSSNELVIDLGSDIIICAAVYQLFYAARVTYSGALRGAGDTIWLAAVSGVGSLVVLGLGGFAITRIMPDLGAIGPWIAATISIMAVGSANALRFKSNRWMKIDLFKHKVVGVPVEIEPVAE
jgi:MATE family multidrug resistance protein